ncbi:MAG TPA: DUF5703 domain-containing protein, partial [Puia sp.]|nr:DUF5703 domain-containing protein [Puia sp.]
MIACKKLLLLLSTVLAMKAGAQNIDGQLDSCNVIWDEPGPDSSASMPTGNGDIGLNVWVEKNGDLIFYIGKTDAWGAETRPEWDNWMKTGGVLMKLGAIRVSLTPSSLANGAAFRQMLRLHESEILVKEGGSTLRVWVDANHPVIRVEVSSPQATAVEVSLEDWRLHQGEGDTVLPGKTGSITWYH